MKRDPPAIENLAGQLALAEQIARQAHAAQVEQFGGGAYVQHLERVVALVAGGDVKAVAWLHDVIEDTGITAEGLRQRGVAPEIVEAVVLLTRGDESYAAYIELVRVRKNPLALAVKIADLRDHLREMPVALPPPQRRRYERALERLIV